MDQMLLPCNGTSCISTKPSRKLHSDLSKYAQLKWAVYHGDRELIDDLLREGTRVNYDGDFHDMRSVLHSAVYLGDPEIVKKLLDQGASINVRNCNYETPLMLAAKMGKSVITDLLLHTKGLQNSHSMENLSHIHIASMRNEVKIVKSLIHSKADINAAVDTSSITWAGFTALHFAVYYGCTETVEYLLSVGADISIGDARKSTPLHLASIMRNEQIIDSILLAHKNILSNPVSSEGVSHFHIACTRNNADVVKQFIENGVDLQSSVPETSRNWHGFTAMDFAIYYECEDVVKVLLMCGDHVKSRTYNDRVGAAYHMGNVNLINLLIGTHDQKIVNFNQMSVLHMAFINNDMEQVKEVISETPSSLNSSIWKGSSPLHLAVESRNFELIKYLLSKGADYEEKNFQGKSALHLAFDRDMTAIVHLILNDFRNFSSNPIDDDGISHLHIACATRHECDAVKRLIELGADVNAPVNSNSIFWPSYTPLHFAVEFQSTDVVKLLLTRRANYSSTDARNLSPFDVAIQQMRDRYESSYALHMMGPILESHHIFRLDSFDDRGFSRLHFMSMQYDYDAGNMRLARIREHIHENPSDVNKPIPRVGSKFDGYTPLHLALTRGPADCVRLLIESGADVFCESENGDTPLYLAMSHRSARSIRMLHNFLQGQPDPVKIKDYSFFHIVCVAGDIGLIKHYLDNGADPNDPLKMVRGYHDYRSPLHIITRGCFSPAGEVTKLLIKFGADPNARDLELNTPLHHVGECSKLEIIDALVNCGADINALNVNFQTPLLSMCEQAGDFNNGEICFEMVKLYLKNGADINLADEDDTTPLTVSSWNILDDEESEGLFEFLREIMGLFLRHVVKLRLIGSYISETNQRAYLSLLRKHSAQQNFNESDFENQCLQELEIMRENRIDGYTTLRDILFKNLNELAVTIENGAFKAIVDSRDLVNDFPIYGFMFALQLRKGLIRRPLLERSLKALNFLIGINLPDACTEKILQYLDNNNLENIILSAESSF